MEVAKSNLMMTCSDKGALEKAMRIAEMLDLSATAPIINMGSSQVAVLETYLPMGTQLIAQLESHLRTVGGLRLQTTIKNNSMPTIAVYLK